MNALEGMIYRNRTRNARAAVEMALAIERGDIVSLFQLRSRYSTKVDWVGLADQSVLRLVESIRMTSQLTDYPCVELFDSFLRDLEERAIAGEVLPSTFEAALCRNKDLSGIPRLKPRSLAAPNNDIRTPRMPQQ